MTFRIEKTTKEELGNSIPVELKQVFRRFLLFSTELWIGTDDEELVCAWGLVASSKIDNRAYLWLYTTPALDGNEFLFVRNSQRWMQEQLEIYSEIHGHTERGRDRSMRWIEWLGGEYGKPEGDGVPFIIRKKQWTRLHSQQSA